MTDTALTRIQGADDSSIDGRWKYALNMAKAGDLIPKGLWDSPAPGVPPQPSPGKIMLVHETGRMLGLHPVAALQGVHVIEGRATISPALMSALVRRDGHRLRVRMEGSVEAGTLRAVAELIRADDPDFTFRSEWTPFRAMRAGLCKYVRGDDGTWSVVARSRQGNPLPWEAFTEALCKARAIGEVCREGAEDSLMGAQYTPEEMGAVVNEDGEITAPSEPSRPWADDLAAATTREEGQRILDELLQSTDFTPALYAAAVARMAVLPADAPAPDEDTYAEDGTLIGREECPVCGMLDGDHDADVHESAGVPL